MILGDDLMMQVENSLLEVMKSMSEVALEAGGMDTLGKTMGKAQRVVEDISVG